MSKTAKIKQFKYAFLKPAQKDKKLVKVKTEIEKSVKTLMKGHDSDVDNKLVDLAKELSEKDEKYMDELIQYKVVKHWDDPKELKFWLTKCSTPAKNVEIIKKILSDTPQKEMVVDCWKRMSHRDEVAGLCYKLFPEDVEDEMVKMMKAGEFPGVPDNRKSALVMRVFEEGDASKLDNHYRFNLDPKDAVVLAKKDPAKFVKVFLLGQPTETKMKFITDPSIRESIETAENEWKELAKSTPLLPFLRNAEKRRKEATHPSPNKAAGVIDSMFAEVVAPDGALGLTYYTNSMTPVPNMLATSKEDQVKEVENRKEGIKKSIELEKKQKKEKGDDTPVDTDRLDAHPDGPGTQCDVLVSLMSNLIKSTLGPDVECKHIVFKGMVLTDKMSKFPGGLLSSSFGGNVYDDSDALTGQVLFTGGADDGVSNAHTILEVNGMQYDAVLGTTGKSLKHTVVDEFPAWDKIGYVSVADGKPIRVSKSTKSDFWIINEPGLKAAPNKHGFGSAYRMTNNPTKYVKPAK